jgi:hypothetical protein
MQTRNFQGLLQVQNGILRNEAQVTAQGLQQHNITRQVIAQRVKRFRIFMRLLAYVHQPLRKKQICLIKPLLAGERREAMQ